MSQILGEDFFENFKKWRRELDVRLEFFPLSDNEKVSLLFSKLDKLFELRHCICHEAYTPVSDDDEIELMSFSPYVSEFLTVTEQYVDEHIKNNLAAESV